MINVMGGRQVSKDKKLKALAALVEKRRKTKMINEYSKCENISYASPKFDSDEYGYKYCITPLSKGACNVESKVMIVLSDWGSTDGFDKINKDGKMNDLVKLGYRNWGGTGGTNTKLNKNIIERHLRKEREDVFITNTFPFIKHGDMEGPIPPSALKKGLEFLEGQMNIVQSKVMFILGRRSKDAFCDYFYNNDLYDITDESISGCHISNEALSCKVFFMKHPRNYRESDWDRLLNKNKIIMSLI